MKFQKHLINISLLSFSALTLPVSAFALEDIPVAESAADFAEQGLDVPELYYFRLRRIELPSALLEKYATAWKHNASIYVEVSQNGKFVWRSPFKDVAMKESVFLFDSNDEKNAFALFLRKGDSIDAKLFAVQKERGATAAAGGVGGAVAGAAIGGLACGLLTGGFGAPAGAAIGAAIGGGVGAGAGALIPVVEGSVEISNFRYDSPDEFFSRKEEAPRIHKGNVLGASTQETALTFSGGSGMQSAKASGELKMQRTYVVQLRSIFLSSENPKLKDDADPNAQYYAILRNGDKSEEIMLGRLPVDKPWALPENLFVVRNQCGTTELEVRREQLGPDLVIFSAKQYGGDGTSWLFMGKVSGEDGTRAPSWIDCVTFEPVEHSAQILK